MQVLSLKRGRLGLSLVSQARDLALQCQDPAQVLRKSAKVMPDWL